VELVASASAFGLDRLDCRGGEIVTDSVVLKIDPPLPCAVKDGSGTCDRPARTAYAYPARGPRPGVWLIMPVCDRCAGMATSDDADANEADASRGEAD
jgi:hypothetical protein